MLVNSIFNSISGEIGTFPQGTFTTFVRLSGCNLRCSYCDTKKTWDDNNAVDLTPDQIYNVIKKIGCKNVLITGGEPLLWQGKGLEELSQLLWHYEIQIETNGTIKPNHFFEFDCFVYDYKPKRIRGNKKWNILPRYLDWIKFGIQTRADYNEAKKIISQYKIPSLAMSAILPLRPHILAEWMKKDKLWNVILNYQIHKVIFDNFDNSIENEIFDITERKKGENYV